MKSNSWEAQMKREKMLEFYKQTVTCSLANNWPIDFRLLCQTRTHRQICKTLTNSKRLKQFISKFRIKWFHNHLKCMYIYTQFFLLIEIVYS